MSALSVCVYCGARDGASPAYAKAAENLGAGLGARNWRLVYGAGDVGLMGRVARASAAAGAETFGVIPEHLVKREVGKTDLTSFIVTETMHERKKIMLMNCDAVVLLPGGAGSMEEFFEALTWAQLELHRKPIIILNISGYWDALIALLHQISGESFADASLHKLYHVADTVDAALTLLEETPRD